MANFSLGACGCCGKAADIQMVIGFLKRVGLGVFGTVEGFTNVPTGPLAPDGDIAYPNTEVRDPLYLVLTNTLVWDDPSATTYTETYTYDPHYQDMDWVTTGAEDDQVGYVPQNLQHIAADYPSNWVGAGYPSPSSTATAIYDGGLWPPTTTLSVDGTALMIQSQSYTDSNGAVHYGFTWTSILTQPYTWEQYAEIADYIANNSATLQDGTLAPTKTYPMSDGGPVHQVKLRYCCEFVAGDPDVTQALIVMLSRDPTTGGDLFQYVKSAGVDWGSFRFFFGSADNGQVLGHLPCSPVPVPWPEDEAPADITWGRFPLAAHGMPFTTAIFAGTGSPVVGIGVPGAPSGSGPYICSVKSSVRVVGDLALNPVTVTYDPTADTLSPSPAGLSGAGEQVFEPSNVGAIGWLWALYSTEASVTARTQPLPGAIPATDPPFMPQGSTLVELKSGQSVTLYACTFDAAGQYMRNVSATWQLQTDGLPWNAITPACLIPSSDGKSAIFTAPSAAGYDGANVQVTVAGLTSVLGITIWCNFGG